MQLLIYNPKNMQRMCGSQREMFVFVLQAAIRVIINTIAFSMRHTIYITCFLVSFA